jgi:flagellar biosynthesis/type III secretory pathway M-ring protein FliF/YscJ
LWGWYLAWGDAVRVYGPARLAEAVDGEAVKVIRSLLAVVLSLVAFVVVYLFAYLVTAAERLRIVQAAGAQRAGETDKGAHAAQQSPHTEEPAEGSEEEVDTSGAEQARDDD